MQSSPWSGGERNDRPYKDNRTPGSGSRHVNSGFKRNRDYDRGDRSYDHRERDAQRHRPEGYDAQSADRSWSRPPPHSAVRGQPIDVERKPEPCGTPTPTIRKHSTERRYEDSRPRRGPDYSGGRPDDSFPRRRRSNSPSPGNSRTPHSSQSARYYPNSSPNTGWRGEDVATASTSNLVNNCWNSSPHVPRSGEHKQHPEVIITGSATNASSERTPKPKPRSLEEWCVDIDDTLKKIQEDVQKMDCSKDVAVMWTHHRTRTGIISYAVSRALFVNNLPVVLPTPEPEPEPHVPVPAEPAIKKDAENAARPVIPTIETIESLSHTTGHVSTENLVTVGTIPSPPPIIVPRQEPPKRAVTVLPSRDMTGGLSSPYHPAAPPRSSPSATSGFRPPPPPGPHPPPAPPPPARPPAPPAPYPQSYHKPPAKNSRWEESRAPRPMHHTNSPRQQYADNAQMYSGPGPAHHNQAYSAAAPPYAAQRPDSNEELEEGEER